LNPILLVLVLVLVLETTRRRIEDEDENDEEDEGAGSGEPVRRSGNFGFCSAKALPCLEPGKTRMRHALQNF